LRLQIAPYVPISIRIESQRHISGRVIQQAKRAAVYPMNLSERPD